MFLQMPWMNETTPPDEFPDVEQALEYPNGLLAAGGDLTPQRLLCAYRRGIFPWFSEGQPVLWWTPDPRAVLFPENLRISRSLRKTLRQGHFTLSADHAFSAVVRHCAMPRATETSTWITGEMIRAYCRLHRLGHARSIETGSSSAASTEWRWAAYSLENPCSAAPGMHRRRPSSACAGWATG